MLLNPYRFGPGGGSGDVDAYWSYVAALLKFDGNFTDSSSSPKTVGNPAGLSTSTAAAKFGQGVQCNYARYVTIAAHDDLRFIGQFTLEFWLRATSAGGTSGWQDQDIFSTDDQFAYMQIRNAAFQFRLGSAMIYSSQDMAGITAWNHIAVTRDASNSLRFFINGVVTATTTNTGNQSVASGYQFGGVNTLAGYAKSYVGKVDEFRFTKGVCRYTGTFSPPTAPFPTA